MNNLREAVLVSRAEALLCRARRLFLLSLALTCLALASLIAVGLGF